MKLVNLATLNYTISMSRHIHILIASLCLSVLNGLHGDDVILRLAPNTAAQIVGSISAQDPVVTNAAPVLDQASAAEGWQWSEYVTNTLGYIPESMLGKNFAVNPDTFVRAAPSSSAAILTTSTAADTYEYVSTDGNWATVRFNKAIPVYFLGTAGASALPATSGQGGITVTYDSEPTEVSEPAVLEIEQPTIESQPTESIIVAQPVEAPIASTPRRPTPTEGIPTRILTGKLIRENTNYGPRYPMRILGKSGDRLAYVDMSQIFISDLRPYLNKEVFIRGEVRPLMPNSKDLVIIARTIQIASN